MISHSVCLSFHCDLSHYSTLQTSKPWWQRLTLIKQYESPVLFRLFCFVLFNYHWNTSSNSFQIIPGTPWHVVHLESVTFSTLCYVTVSFRRGSIFFLRIQHKTPHNRYSQPLLICLLMHLWQQLQRQVFLSMTPLAWHTYLSPIPLCSTSQAPSGWMGSHFQMMVNKS